jgi:hypothetical protein
MANLMREDRLPMTRNQNLMSHYTDQSILSGQHPPMVPAPTNMGILSVGYEPRSLPSHSTHSPLARRPQSGDWTHLPSSMESLSLESLKEPPSTSTNGLNSRRHTVSVQDDLEPFPSKVPLRTQAAIEKVAEIVNKMGGQIRTHIQDNGGPPPPPPSRSCCCWH